MAVTGMRVSEAVGLRLGDLTADGVIVRDTKFAKTRLLPLHPSTWKALDSYLIARTRHTDQRRPLVRYRSRHPADDRKHPQGVHRDWPPLRIARRTGDGGTAPAGSKARIPRFALSSACPQARMSADTHWPCPHI